MLDELCWGDLCSSNIRCLQDVQQQLANASPSQPEVVLAAEDATANRLAEQLPAGSGFQQDLLGVETLAA